MLKKVEPLDSKSDDLLQVTDLVTGCVNHRLGHPAGERKQQLRRKAEELGLISDQNIWVRVSGFSGFVHINVSQKLVKNDSGGSIAQHENSHCPASA